MKGQQSKLTAGVWMDHHKAIFIASENEAGYAILDKVKAGQYHGDKGEHASNNAEKTDNRTYFKHIANLLLKYDEILIFGPGKAQEEFHNFLNDNSRFANKKITLNSAGQISDNQMIAVVRDFFDAS